MTRKDTVFFSVIYHLLYDGKPSFPKEISGREKIPWNKLVCSTGEEFSDSNPSLFPVFLMDFVLPVTDSDGDAQEWPGCLTVAYFGGQSCYSMTNLFRCFITHLKWTPFYSCFQPSKMWYVIVTVTENHIFKQMSFFLMISVFYYESLLLEGEKKKISSLNTKPHTWNTQSSGNNNRTQ